MSNGTTQAVKSQAPGLVERGVATVNSAGVVTGVTAGESDITATYQNVAGRSHVAIGRTTYTVSGNAADGSSGGVLPGITVQVVDGIGNTQSTKTDSAGAYTSLAWRPGPPRLPHPRSATRR